MTHFMLFERHSLLHDVEAMPSLISHGSSWCYDTYVPVVFAGGSGVLGASIANSDR
jgi:hypothetical protein